MCPWDAVVDAPSLQTFKARVDVGLSGQPDLVDVPAHCGGVGLDGL